MANNYDVPNWAGKPTVGLHLDVLKDDKLIQKLMIDEKKCYFFGRNQHLNDFSIDHASCSRVHAVIVYHKFLQRAFLVDLGSTHGTYIGNLRLETYKPTQLLVNSTFHFGASTRYYILRERPHPSNKVVVEELETNIEDHDSSGLFGLPETERELDNLTEFNTAHNRRISMLGITDDDVHKSTRKRKKKGISFNDDEEIINPEDVDPSVGRFRNLIQTTVVPTKKMRIAGGLLSLPGELNSPLKHSEPKISSCSLYHNLPLEDFTSSSNRENLFNKDSNSFSSSISIGLPNPAPDVNFESKQIYYHNPQITDLDNLIDIHAFEPKKKKYAKEAWPGKKPIPSLLI